MSANSQDSQSPFGKYAPPAEPILHDKNLHSQVEVCRGSIEVNERPLEDPEVATAHDHICDSDSILSGVMHEEDAFERLAAMTPLRDRESDPVIMRVDGTSSLTTLQEHRLQGWRDIARCDLSNMKLRGESFVGVNFEGTKLDGADFADCDFRRSNLNNVSAQNCNFEGADFSGAKLSSTVFQGSNFALVRFYSHAADLAVASFDRVDFCDCNLSHAVFGRLRAGGAVLEQRCQLVRINFSGSDMTGCVLRGCDLRTCCFFGTNLFASNLVQCNLAGVDLSTTGLINANLSKILYSEDSTFPTGFETPIDSVVARLRPKDDLQINSFGRELQSSLIILAAFALVFAVIVVGLNERYQTVEFVSSESRPAPRSSARELGKDTSSERLRPFAELPEESLPAQPPASGEPKEAHGQEGRRIENSIGMELVLIEPGTFNMGSNLGEPSEKPTHPVVITKQFYLAIHEVTQQQYFDLMTSNPSQFRGYPNNPVERVSWNDATRFCQELSALPSEVAARRSYRLPTEAEWEYACRAGSENRYSFGDEGSQLHEHGWFDQNSGGRTQSVGMKNPNEWGLYDMHGNVWEWCFDTEDKYSSDKVTDPIYDTVGLRRILRGGSWGHPLAESRSANRDRTNARNATKYIGFRVAMNLVLR